MYCGITKWKKLTPIVRQNQWMQKTCYLYFILPDQQESLKVWFIHVEDTWYTPIIHSIRYFNIKTIKSIGVPQILAGLQGIPISFMLLYWRVQHLSFMKGYQHFLMQAVFGKLLINTK